MDLENGLEIINVDKTVLKTIPNNLDTGAIQILEGLDMFCEDMLDKYSETSSVPYEKLFNALRQVIGSALETKDVREAVMTGIIKESGKEIKPVKKAVIKKTIKVAEKTKKNIEEVRDYAKDKTIPEIMQHFSFTSKSATKNFVNYYKIEYKKSSAGRKRQLNTLQVGKVKDLYKNNISMYKIANLMKCDVNVIFDVIHQQGAYKEN